MIPPYSNHVVLLAKATLPTLCWDSRRVLRLLTKSESNRLYKEMPFNCLSWTYPLFKRILLSIWKNTFRTATKRMNLKRLRLWRLLKIILTTWLLNAGKEIYGTDYRLIYSLSNSYLYIINWFLPLINFLGLEIKSNKTQVMKVVKTRLPTPNNLPTEIGR